MTQASVVCQSCKHRTIFANATAGEMDNKTAKCPNCQTKMIMERVGANDLKGYNILYHRS